MLQDNTNICCRIIRFFVAGLYKYFLQDYTNICCRIIQSVADKFLFSLPGFRSLMWAWQVRLKKGNRVYLTQLREVCKKSKWKFKMAFAMNGGGGVETGLKCHIPILKNDFC